jgi:hypothetical protein
MWMELISGFRKAPSSSVDRPSEVDEFRAAVTSFAGAHEQT